MTIETHPVHPDISEQMWEKVNEVILEYREVPGSVITVLRLSQDEVGYLPIELIDHVAEGMNLPASEVFGVATFYSLFSLKPKGRHVIKACTGTACYVKGIKEIMSHITNRHGIKEGETMEDKRFSLEGVRCLGACGLAPVLIVGEDIHGNLKSDEIIGILKDYK
jgi:NADH:ubiquinone oxidoreductase subunit E